MKQIFILVCLSFSLCSLAQQWIRTYGSGYVGSWVIEHYDKGYIITGTKASNAGYGWVIKTDINGTMLWSKHIGRNSYHMFINNIELTNDNGLIIAGTTSKTGLDNDDAYILKLNTCGELEWCTDVYTPTIYDLGWRVKPTSENGYILLGLYNNASSKLRTNLFKFDFQGNLLWHQAYLPDSLAFGDDGQDLLVDSSGYLITASAYYPDPGQTGGYERFYFIKTDTSGNKIWSCVYEKNSYYHGRPWATIHNGLKFYYSFGIHDVNGSASFRPALVKILPDGSDSYNKNITTSSSVIATANWLNDTTLILGGGGGNGNSTLNIMYKTDTLGNLKDSVHLATVSGAYAILFRCR